MFKVLMLLVFLCGCTQKSIVKNEYLIKMTGIRGEYNQNNEKNLSIKEKTIDVDLRKAHFKSFEDVFIYYYDGCVKFGNLSNIVSGAVFANIYRSDLRFDKILYADRDIVVFCHDNKVSVLDLHEDQNVSLLVDHLILKCARIGDILFMFKESADDCYSSDIYVYDLNSKRVYAKKIKKNFTDFGVFDKKLFFVDVDDHYCSCDLSFELTDYQNKMDDNGYILHDMLLCDKGAFFSYGNFVNYIEHGSSEVQKIDVSRIAASGVNKLFYCDGVVYLLLNNTIVNLFDQETIVFIDDHVLDVKVCSGKIAIVGRKKILLTNNQHLINREYYQEIINLSYDVSMFGDYMLLFNKNTLMIYDVNDGVKVFGVNGIVDTAKMYGNVVLCVLNNDLMSFALVKNRLIKENRE